MSLVALFSDKGSPGVTTLALALATVWPRKVALAELDPAGGDLALRLTDPRGHPVLRPHVGLLSLAAAVRGDQNPELDLIWRHTQPLTASDAPVVLPGLSSAEQGAGIATLWPALTGALTGVADGDVLADLGRAHPDNPALRVAAEADVLVGVARASAESMLRLRDRMGNLLARLHFAPGRPRRAVVVLVAEDRAGSEAVAAMRAVIEHAGFPVTVAGFVAIDPGTVQALTSGRLGSRAHRSLLMRSTRALVPHVQVQVHGATSTEPADLPVRGTDLAATR